ncbi:MAG: ATP-binding protein, partial [Candidatus Geothermincolia bacterium]
ADLDMRADVELRKAIEMRESLKALTDEIAGEEEVEEEAEPPAIAGRERAPRARRRGLVSVSAGFVLIVLGIILGAAVHPALFSVVAPGALLLALGSYFLAADRPRPVEAPGPEEETGEPEEKPIEESLVRAGAQVEKLDVREREFLESVECETPEEFFKRFAEYRGMMSERMEAAAGLKALLGGRTLAQVEADRRKAAVAVSASDERLAELAAFQLPPDRLEAAVRERKDLASELDRLETERDGLSFHLVKTASDPEDAIKIEEVVTWLWEAEKSARRRLRVSTLARDAMRQASEEMLSSAVPVLAESVGHTFSRLTGGRYTDVEVRESDLAISVFSPEKRALIPAEEMLSILSKGTASQLYLSARLELVGLLSGGRKPPLIFDDSFSYFDDRRLAALWAVLEEAARDQQVLVFTCTERYDELAGDVNVIDLSR